MGLAVVHTRALVGMEALPVQAEVNVARGLSQFQIIGLPETTVREAKDRVRTALLNCGYDFPVGRITVNLSPADLPKQGARYDLAIALGVLLAAELVEIPPVDDIEVYAELGLNGELRPVQGTLSCLLACQRAGRLAIIASGNRNEAQLLREPVAYGFNRLNEVVEHLSGANRVGLIAPAQMPLHLKRYGDMQDVRGQAQAKRALLLAAAGGHHLLLVGPPGTGKTMLAQRLLSILPPLDEQASLEVAAIQSLGRDGFDPANWRLRPLRSPHHTCSAAALIGGGSSIPRPGEITLAHYGILFLDETAEMSRHVLDSLREPLESGKVCISRAQHQAVFPARFQLVCALNPSPCGQFNGELASARSTPDQIIKYLSKLSGPFLDRIDIQVEVPRQADALRYSQKPLNTEEPDSAALAEQVVRAQQVQYTRQGTLNHDLRAADIGRYCALSEPDHGFLVEAMKKLKLSHRAFHRTLRLARTIADIESSDIICRHHLTEALSYRALDTLLTRLNAL